jgi:hypothetical protein
MICGNCKIDRLVTDFIKNQKYCYRCEYQKKIAISPVKQVKENQKCRYCNKEIIHIENLRKRQRTVFCSQECAENGHKNLTNNHWTRKLRNRIPWQPKGVKDWNIDQI